MAAPEPSGPPGGPVPAAGEPLTDEWLERNEIPRSTSYPPYVATEEDKRRWDLCLEMARQTFGDRGDDGVWMAARALYHGDSPSDGVAIPPGGGLPSAADDAQAPSGRP